MINTAVIPLLILVSQSNCSILEKYQYNAYNLRRVRLRKNSVASFSRTLIHSRSSFSSAKPISGLSSSFLKHFAPFFLVLFNCDPFQTFRSGNLSFSELGFLLCSSDGPLIVTDQAPRCLQQIYEGQSSPPLPDVAACAGPGLG